MSSAQITLRKAIDARAVFLQEIRDAVSDLVIDLYTSCGIEIDTKTFEDAVTDGVADMLGEEFARLEREAEEESGVRAAAERRADLADFHGRAAE